MNGSSNDSSNTFLHVLTFECSRCETPVVEWALSSLRSPESVDGTMFQLKCSCGWSDGRMGAQARNHLTLPWTASVGEPSSNGQT
jgi:hypothetical protein